MLSVRTIPRRLKTDRRLARMLQGGLSSLAGRGTALLASAITLPLTVRYLGAIQYGVWVTISTSVVMLAMLDIGIANTLTNLIAKAYSDDDSEQAGRYYATAFWSTVSLVGMLGIVAFYVWAHISWAAVFNVRDPVVVLQAKQCAGIATCFFLMSMPLGLGGRALSGYQEVHIANYFAMINSVLGLIAIMTVVWVHGTMVALMAAYCSAMLTGSIVLNLWLFLFHKRFLIPLPSRVRLRMVRNLLGEGVLFFLLQISSVVVFNSDNLVIAHFLSPREVTPYSVAWRAASYATMLQTLLIPSAWPAFTEAYHRGDLTWIRKTYRDLRMATQTAVGAAALIIGLSGRWLIRLWAGPIAVPSRSIIWWMALWALLSACTTNQALLLTATSRLKLESFVAVAAAIANLTLSLYLVTRVGALGVIAATVVSFLVFIVGPQEWEVRRVLSGAYLRDAIGGCESR